MADVNVTLDQTLTIVEVVTTSPINLHFTEALSIRDLLIQSGIGVTTDAFPNIVSIPTIPKMGKLLI